MGSPLAAWLERTGTKQADLAERLGVSQSQISAWVSGRALPRAETLLELSEFTGIELEELVRFSIEAGRRAAAEGL